MLMFTKWDITLLISSLHQQSRGMNILRNTRKIFTTPWVKIASKFDAENWLYNTRERFDMFYPSYGDTYPTYNGAVGMTFEQGGIGAGREVLMENGSSLTIKDRLTHHAKAVLTAVEVATSESDKLIEGFES
jgi:hypothetical protein